MRVFQIYVRLEIMVVWLYDLLIIQLKDIFNIDDSVYEVLWVDVLNENL